MKTQHRAIRTARNFWIFLKKHHRKILLVGSLTMLAVVILPQLTFAQGTSASGEVDKIYQSIANFLTLILEFMQRLLWPVLLLIGGLMKNDLLFDAAMEDLMINIWANVRNIVNILMVLVLLGIAFYNVMGLGQNYHIKTILPKFIIALIAVNFSYLAVKVVIDGVNVVSTAIFALPISVSEGLGNQPFQDALKQNQVCEGFYGKGTVYDDNIAQAGETALCDGSKLFTDKAKVFFNRYDGNNAGVVLAVNLAKISDLDKVSVSGLKADLKNLVINMLFSVVFYVVYASSFIALFFVLLARLIVLWVTIVLSPLAILPYVLPEKLKSQLGEAGKLQEEFVKHAIVPIPIALIMTIGFIMLDGLQKSTFAGSPTLATQTQGVNFLSSGLTTFQDLIVAVGMVGVVWTGVFAAASNTMAKGITDGIKGTVETAGKFLGTSFKYAPIFPVTGVKDEQGKPMKASLATAMGALKELPLARETKSRDEARKLFEAASGQEGNKIANRLEKANTMDGIKQELSNAKSFADPSTKAMQLSLGRAMSQTPEWKSKMILPPKLLDKDNKEFKKEELEKKLKEGKVSETTMREIAEMNTQNVKPVQEPEPKPPAPGEKKETVPGAIDADKADTLGRVDSTGAYGAALGTAGAAAVDKYKKAAAGKDEKAKAKALEDPAAQGALKKMDTMLEQGSEFKKQTGTVVDKEGLNKLIEDRKKQLMGEDGKAMTETQADTIIRIELEPMNQRAEGKKIIESGGKAKEIIDKIAMPKPPEPAKPAQAPGARPPAGPAGAPPKPPAPPQAPAGPPKPPAVPKKP